MIEISLGLKIDADEFEKQLTKGIKAKFTEILFKSQEEIRKDIKEMIGEAIWQSPEAISLQGGKLQAELGVENPADAINQIVAAVQNSVNVVVTPNGLSIVACPTDLSNILSISSAKFWSENGFLVSWLEWLLTSGDSIIVPDYFFAEGNYPRSRTGLGVMKRGGTWHVPAEFAGTFQDNWFTRLFAHMGPEITTIINNELKP